MTRHIAKLVVTFPGRALFRRLLVLFAPVAATMVLAAPASASGAQTFTQTFHGTFPTIVVGPLCGAPAGTLSGSGNQIFHITVNGAGDTWITTTEEESFTLVQNNPSLPTYSGHLEVWFGASLNNSNAVTHDVFNVHATGSDGSMISFHILVHLSLSANGQVNSFSTCG